MANQCPWCSTIFSRTHHVLQHVFNAFACGHCDVDRTLMDYSIECWYGRIVCPLCYDEFNTSVSCDAISQSHWHVRTHPSPSALEWKELCPPPL
eukprot:11015845-Lingulodinium_polyedra.AAC.1